MVAFDCETIVEELAVLLMTIPTDNCPLACPANAANGFRIAITKIVNFRIFFLIMAIPCPILRTLWFVAAHF